MHAIRLHEFGPASNLVLDELPDLEPAAGQVRIAVEAAGVHLVDTTLRRGEPGPIPLAGAADDPRAARSPASSTGSAPASTRPGSAAGWSPTSARCPVGTPSRRSPTSTSLIDVPDHVGFPDAIAAVGTGRTALGVLELEPPATDDVVLVPSAAGGLGWLLAQAALEVAPAWSPRPAAPSGSPRSAARRRPRRRLLASRAGRSEVRERTDGVTLVYDGVGGDVGRQALELLRPGGRLVMFGYSAGHADPLRHRRPGRAAASPPAGASGPRMMALPGGIPGLAARALERVAAGRLAAAGDDVPPGRRGPRARRSRGSAGPSARSSWSCTR